MTVWSLTSSAAAVFSSPNTQLQEVRLAMTSTCAAASAAWTWPYVLYIDALPPIPYVVGPQMSTAVTVAQGVSSTWAELNPH